MWNLKIKVIKVGSATIDPGNVASPIQVQLKHQLGIGGGSTVVIVREGDEVLLVDTGFEQEADFSLANKRKNWKLLRSLLELNDIRPEQITKVFLTHFHADHSGNLEFFGQALWYGHPLAINELDSPIKERVIPLKDGDTILSNTRVIHTPGHTKGHCSLLWKDKEERIKVAICGDAIINLSWLQSRRIWKFNGDFYDLDVARESIRRLIKEADILIPGHGQPFFKPLNESWDCF